MDKNMRFTVKDVTIATGLTQGIIRYRIKKMDICRGHTGLSYDDIKAILTYKPKMLPRQNSQKRIDALRLQLRNDGFNTK